MSAFEDVQQTDSLVEACSKVPWNDLIKWMDVLDMFVRKVATEGDPKLAVTKQARSYLDDEGETSSEIQDSMRDIVEGLRVLGIEPPSLEEAQRRAHATGDDITS